MTRPKTTGDIIEAGRAALETLPPSQNDLGTNMNYPTLPELLDEYARALAYTDDLWRDLGEDEVHWRPNVESSAIGWHLGHQAAVSHYMVRNLTAAEPSPDGELDSLMDSATAERQRGDLPSVSRIADYRTAVAERVRFRVGQIDRGEVGAPVQLRRIAENMMVAIVNHEYQHSKWIGETRSGEFSHDLPDLPLSEWLSVVDGYVLLGA